MPNTTPPDDLLSLLQEDHELVKRRFVEVIRAGEGTRGERFWTLTDDLVRHEVAEEAVVYPAVRSLPGGDGVADARIAEQSQAEEKLAALERLGIETPEFPAELASLERDVLHHAQREEGEVFPLLQRSLSSQALVELGQRYAAAKRSAPNHPHPGAPDTPPGNTIVGPIAALFDRIRDSAARV